MIKSFFSVTILVVLSVFVEAAPQYDPQCPQNPFVHGQYYNLQHILTPSAYLFSYCSGCISGHPELGQSVISKENPVSREWYNTWLAGCGSDPNIVTLSAPGVGFLKISNTNIGGESYVYVDAADSNNSWTVTLTDATNCYYTLSQGDQYLKISTGQGAQVVNPQKPDWLPEVVSSGQDDSGVFKVIPLNNCPANPFTDGKSYNLQHIRTPSQYLFSYCSGCISGHSELDQSVICKESPVSREWYNSWVASVRGANSVALSAPGVGFLKPSGTNIGGEAYVTVNGADSNNVWTVTLADSANCYYTLSQGDQFLKISNGQGAKVVNPGKPDWLPEVVSSGQDDSGVFKVIPL